MKILKNSLYLLLISALLVTAAGCTDNLGDSSKKPAAETVDETALVAEEASGDEAPEILVSEGKNDRLPGSLKWVSVSLYNQGFDFFADQEKGLLSTQSTSQSKKGSAETTGDASAAENEGSTTTSHQSSAGGVSTDVTVDGSMTVTESTTVDGQSGTIWWEMDNN